MMEQPPEGSGSRPHEVETSGLRGAPASRAARWLEQHGGFLLIACGLALIALAAVLSSRPAVALIFAVFGPGLIALGCFYTRIEGRVEATREGIKTVVREIDRLANERQLRPESVPVLIEAALDRLPNGVQDQGAARRTATEIVREAEAASRAEAARMSLAFAEWLESEGWTVATVADAHAQVPTALPGSVALHFITALTDDEILLAHIIPEWGASAHDVQRAAAMLGRDYGSRKGRAAVVTKYRWDEMHPYTAGSAEYLGVSVYTVSEDGTVRMPSNPFPSGEADASPGDEYEHDEESDLP